MLLAACGGGHGGQSHGLPPPAPDMTVPVSMPDGVVPVQPTPAPQAPNLPPQQDPVSQPAMPPDMTVPVSMPDRVVSVQPAPAPRAPDPPPQQDSASPPAMPPEPDPQTDYVSWGSWADFDQGYFRVEGPTTPDDGTAWTVHGTPTGLVDSMPRVQPELDIYTYDYEGHVWGRADGNNRVTGQMWAVYGPRGHYGPGADDVVSIHLSHMYKELSDGSLSFLPGMFYHGNVGTDYREPGYDPALDTATFFLTADQFDTTPGREEGEATGGFYGPTGEAIAGTFWYRRDGHRIEGVFGGGWEQ